MRLPPAFIGNSKNIHVIIETPAGTGSKYVYDPGFDIFKLKKILPKGTVFPYHFGFIPHTEAEDGDPLDALVLMNEPSYPGCLIECRLLGVIEAEEKSDKGIRRNDRFIAAPIESEYLKRVQNFTDMEQYEQDEIVNFLLSYTRLSKKEFRPLHNRGFKAAVELIQKQQINGYH